MVEEHSTNLTCRIEEPNSGSTTAATTPGGISGNAEEKSPPPIEPRPRSITNEVLEENSSSDNRSPTSPKPSCSGQNSQPNEQSGKKKSPSTKK